MGELNIGFSIPLENGKQAIIKKKLGQGGQGAVYLSSVGGNDYALKWFLKNREIGI